MIHAQSIFQRDRQETRHTVVVVHAQLNKPCHTVNARASIGLSQLSAGAAMLHVQDYIGTTSDLLLHAFTNDIEGI